jgi:predicted Zn-dependent protease
MAGDEKESEGEFHALFARYPKAENLHYLRGYLLFGKDPAQAVEEFKRELDINAANASAEMMLSWSLLQQDDPTDALPYAEKAAAVEPASPTVQLVLGRSLVETRAVRTGLEHLQTAVKSDPDNLEIHLALVKAYSELGQKPEAQQERLLCLALTRNEAPVDRP